MKLEQNQDTNEIKAKIKKEYKKNQSFKKHYITGAIGGFRNPYDFRLAFYNVDSTDLIINMQERNDLKNDDDNLNEKEFKSFIKEKKLTHEILCEIIMSKKAVKELYGFIGKELERIGELKPEKSEK